MARDILSEIDGEAIDGDLSKALRLCLSLGGATSSSDLRSWASKELSGYRDEELPNYRLVYAPLAIDGMTIGAIVKGQTISTHELPDVARGEITEEVRLVYSVPTLEDMVVSARKSDDTIKLSPPGSQELVMLMNSEAKQAGRVERLYWAVSPTAVVDTLETIRSKLVELVAEMRAGMDVGDHLPSPGVAEQAVQVVIHGDKNRVKLNRTQTLNVDTGQRKGRFRTAVEVVAGLAAIAAFLWAVYSGWSAVFG